MERPPRLLGIIAAVCLITTVLWLALFIYGIATQGAVESAEQALEAVAALDPIFYLTYINATLVTLSATMLLAGLAARYWSKAPLWVAMGAAFIPVYSLMNLFAYLSQIAIVPRLAVFSGDAPVLVAQMVQQWPSSAVNTINNLGYAVLGIPSIILGVLLAQDKMRAAGWLLALSGGASILGFGGIVAENGLLSNGSILGGVLFLAALVPMSVSWLQRGKAR